MKKIIMILFMFMGCKSQLWAQHYVTLDVGFCLTFYNSEDLGRFKETYNLVNSPNLALPMQGIGGAEGLRWEVGYRYFGRLGTAVLAGLQNYTRKDLAQYNNGEARKFKLKMSSLYVEYEIGRTWNNFFLNSVFTIFLNRKLTLESKYSVPIGELQNNPLNGTYKSDTSLSIDLGIAVGIFREPIFLIGKITYPLFTGGQSKVLQDKSIDKVADGTDIFPNDFVHYVNGEAYDGVTSNIDGLKILLTIAIAIPLK